MVYKSVMDRFIDSWNPASYDAALLAELKAESDNIIAYWRAGHALMQEHLNSNPYESLKPNPHTAIYLELQERLFTPLLAKRRVRLWHYTRLLDEEAAEMRDLLRLSTLPDLRRRLDRLERKALLTLEEADEVFSKSPMHSQGVRAGKLYTTTAPLPPQEHGVVPLLASWGGESAYFWQRNQSLKDKLRQIGKPRIVEIEARLPDWRSAYSIAGIVMRAWARTMGCETEPLNLDFVIGRIKGNARVAKIHSNGDDVFDSVGSTYPSGCEAILRDQS